MRKARIEIQYVFFSFLFFAVSWDLHNIIVVVVQLNTNGTHRFVQRLRHFIKSLSNESLHNESEKA